MNMNDQKQRAVAFLALHHANGMFVLPNVWDGGSARVFETQGFSALATTSAGIAYAMGYADGEVIGIDDLCCVTRQISQRINIPLSVDI